MGFLNEFAYGFSQAAKPMLEARAKANADADARIREKVAEVDPAAELYQRQKDIDLATESAKMKQQMAELMQVKNQTDTPTTPPASPAAPTDGGVTAPAPTITNPSAGSSFFSQPVTTKPEVDHFGNYLKADKDAGTYEEYSKVNPLFSGLAAEKRTEANMHLKMHTEEEKNRAELSTASHATSADIMKDAEDRADAKKNPNMVSLYQTDAATKHPATLIGDSLQKEKDIAGTIHAPLTAAQMKEEGLKKDNNLVKSETVQPTKDLVTLKDPNSSWEDKQTAWHTLKTYLTQTYGSNAWDKIQNDDNLKVVFKDPALRENIYRVEHDIPPQNKGTASTTNPLTSTSPAQPPLKQDAAKPVLIWNPSTGKLE